MLSEAVKILKGEYALRAIKVHNMDKAIIFCRTKVDCDNMENYLNKAGGGTASYCSRMSIFVDCLCLSVSMTVSLASNDYWKQKASVPTSAKVPSGQLDLES